MITWIINIFKGKKKTKLVSSTVISNTNDNNTDGNGESDISMKNSIIEQTKRDPYNLVINDSKNRLANLKIYVNFFNDNILGTIYNHTKLIHDIFDNNKELKYNKLEQYHYMYTDHLIDLLSKTKKTSDENYYICNSQLESYNKTSENLKLLLVPKTDQNEKLRYSRYISLQLSTIYNCLLDNFDDFRFVSVRNLVCFSKITNDLKFYNIPEEIYEDLCIFEIEKNYTYKEYYIDRLLLGKLKKNLFNIDFVDVFSYSKHKVELFKLTDTDVHFIYLPSINIFKIVDIQILKKYISDNNTKCGNAKLELQTIVAKINQLNNQKDNIKNFDDKTMDILKKYLTKIEEIELNDNIAEVDLERRNLESMLELTRLDI